MAIPTSGYFLVLASRLTNESMTYRWVITCLIFAASPGMLAMIHICDPSAVPSFQMGDGSVVILFVLIVLFVLSLEYLGVRRPV